ncbi:MAG: SAM-dependent DNA methyltransferase [Candidatus Sericytochromatia bacterium]|nr:SAM-dependent DNA methyltransferase [Candidatus Sericytochromatia bacterium]
MITGELKNKIDKIWETFWTGGITNPLTVIEQFTYLLFIKGLDDRQLQFERNASLTGLEPERIFPEALNHLRWSHFKHKPAEVIFALFSDNLNGVFAFIKNLHGDKHSAFSQYMGDALFLIPTPAMLEKLVTAIDNLELTAKDAKGDLYEYLLSKVATAGTNGQFRTPRHIIAMMVELMQPTPQDIIVDPAAGTSGFLVAACEYLTRHAEHSKALYKAEHRQHFNSAMFHGFDMDRTMLSIGAMNMMLHGVENPNIAYRDSLSEQNPDRDKYTLILANPPFKGSLDYESVSPDLLKVTKTKKTELLFLALMLRMLKKGGRCAVIVPDGVLFGSSTTHKAIRKEIVEQHHLKAIISMPSGIFKPYAGVSTGIMIFEKTGSGGTDGVWFYDMTADGYSLDDKRQPVSDNDIPDILARYGQPGEASRSRTEKSFVVPKAEIVDKGYDLSINRYKELVYESVSYDSPAVILNKVAALENEIQQGIETLRGILV